MYKENGDKIVSGQWTRQVDEVQMAILRITRLIKIERRKWQGRRTRVEEERGALVTVMLCTSGPIALDGR